MQVAMPQSKVIILTDPISDLSVHRNGVSVYPIQGEYSRDKLMLQRIRSYIVRLHCTHSIYRTFFLKKNSCSSESTFCGISPLILSLLSPIMTINTKSHNHLK